MLNEIKAAVIDLRNRLYRSQGEMFVTEPDWKLVPYKDGFQLKIYLKLMPRKKESAAINAVEHITNLAEAQDGK